MDKLYQLTDDELVTLYCNGNDEAFDMLLDRHKSKLYSYIYYTVHDEDVANDLFQDTFVKVITHLQAQRYVPTGKFQGWTRRIAHNLIMDYYRDRQSENTVSNEAEDGTLIYGNDLTTPSFEMQSIHDQSVDEVEGLYKLLPQEQSRIVFMRFYQDMSFREIAEELGISINTALGRMRYAIINMRKMAREKNICISLDC